MHNLLSFIVLSVPFLASPSLHDTYSRCIHSKWGQDPFAYGSWSFIKRKPPKEESKEKEKEKEKKILTRPEQIALTEKTEKNGSISTDDSSSDSSEDGDDDSSEDLENVDEVWGSLLYCAGEAMR